MMKIKGKSTILRSCLKLHQNINERKENINKHEEKHI